MIDTERPGGFSPISLFPAFAGRSRPGSPEPGRPVPSRGSPSPGRVSSRGGAPPGALAAACALCAALVLPLFLGSCSRKPAGTKGSSLILVTMDTTRADALGCLGGPAWATPNLDALARGGVLFSQARTAAPVTLPSHATILTGLAPFEHSVRDNATYVLPGGADTLAERLKRAGYATGAVIGAFVLHSSFGLDQGFDVYSDVPQRELTLGPAEDQRTAKEVTDEALSLLGRLAGRGPVFLWVHYFDPHFPYRPPMAYRMKASGGGGRLPQDYMGEVAYMDAEIGRLLEGARKILPEEKILTALVADHGEGLGDHGEDTHAFALFDTTVHVPMILHHEALPRGKAVTAPVSTEDLAPTLLGLLGIGHEGMSGLDLSFLFEEEKTGPREGNEQGGQKEGKEKKRDDSERMTAGRAVYFETAHPYLNHGWSPLFGLLEWPYKLIDGPNPRLFDLAADPREEKNLAKNDPGKVRRMREAFRAMAPRTRRPERIEQSREDRERIENLGYLGSSRNRSSENDLLPPGRLEEGLRDPEEGLAVWSRASKARALSLSRSIRDQRKAVELIEEVLAEDPGNPAFQGYAGSIYFRTKHYREAIKLLEQSLAGLEDPTTRENLASCYTALGNEERATELLEVNARLHPFDLVSRFKLGEALLKMGKPKEALEELSFFLAHHAARNQLHKAAEILKAGAERQL